MLSQKAGCCHLCRLCRLKHSSTHLLKQKKKRRRNEKPWAGLLSSSSGGTGAPGSPGPGKLFRSTSCDSGVPVPVTTTTSFGSSTWLEMLLLKVTGGKSLGTVEWIFNRFQWMGHKAHNTFISKNNNHKFNVFTNKLIIERKLQYYKVKIMRLPNAQV